MKKIIKKLNKSDKEWFDFFVYGDDKYTLVDEEVDVYDGKSIDITNVYKDKDGLYWALDANNISGQVVISNYQIYRVEEGKIERTIWRSK